MTTPKDPPSSVDYVLARMAPEVAESFSQTQYEALREALVPRRHGVNLRLSVPCLQSRLYLVVLAGTDVRSAHRRSLDTAHHPLWTPMNMVAMAGIMGVGMLALLALLQLGQANVAGRLDPKTAPAAIPFKEDQRSCEASGRVWQDDTCLDYAHDPTF
ncbi:MAG: hypothetical protein ACHWZW_11495 [Spirulina sp.]